MTSFLLPPAAAGAPSKALSESLVWPLSNLYWLRKTKNAGQQHHEPLDHLLLKISPNFSFLRMRCQLVYRKSCGFSEQAHSCIFFLLGYPRESTVPLRRRIGKDVGLVIGRRRFSSCMKRGNIGTFILLSCPSLENRVTLHSTSWWPWWKTWHTANLVEQSMGRVFGWPWWLKILSYRWWIFFTVYRILMKDMVCTPEALKGIDTLDPFPLPSNNIAMKMQSIQFLTSPPPTLKSTYCINMTFFNLGLFSRPWI